MNKEKAQALVNKFENAIYEKFTYTSDGVEAIALAKQAALICCDEILEYLPIWKNPDTGVKFNSPEYEFWEKVKEEIKLM